MKRKTLIALAVASLFAAPVAYAVSTPATSGQKPVILATEGAFPDQQEENADLIRMPILTVEGEEKKDGESSQLIAEGEDKSGDDAGTYLIVEGEEKKDGESSQLIAEGEEKKDGESTQLIAATEGAIPDQQEENADLISTPMLMVEGEEKKDGESSQLIAEGEEQKEEGSSNLIAEGEEKKDGESTQLIA